ncbi:MAG TPA: hypothetical protein VGQ39_18950 [Pyrinomonadaceae bacterium]|jgi:hypothetical protein|nr:hypothetical protein [Pyrinomonadaceae bacterium]
MTNKDALLKLLEGCTREERMEIFKLLRKEIPIHELEAKLNTQAEVILEAMARSSDLTMRGIRGIIAEAAFLLQVLQKLEGWKVGNIVGNAAYDFIIEDSIGRVNIQVKMQRKEKGIPLVRKHKFVVETQKTRGGKDAAGEDTRPYRFGEFDIIAVSLHPATNDWTRFAYTVGTWLRPRQSAAHLLEVLQPVAPTPNDDWTDNLEKCIEWFRSGVQRTIAPF